MSSSALSLNKKKVLYRYLTGPDDTHFCQRVTEALNDGWTLYGSPCLTFDATRACIICGQALTKESDMDEEEGC